MTKTKNNKSQKENKTTKKLNITVETVSWLLFFALIVAAYIYLTYKTINLQEQLNSCYTIVNIYATALQNTPETILPIM